MSTLAEVMAPVRHVLLDFDGPVCSVFGGLPASVVARRLAESIDEDMPDDVVGTDPLALLSVFADRDHETLVAAEAKLRELEVEAVLTAPITPGVVEALEAFRDSGRTVTIVSNNSAAAVRRFLDDHQLDRLVTDVCSRERPEPDLLKPSPYLLEVAIKSRRAERGECVMVGDSSTDLDAAHAADTPAILFSNKPGKLRHVLAARPEPKGAVHSMAELACSALTGGPAAGRVPAAESGGPAGQTV